MRGRWGGSVVVLLEDSLTCTYKISYLDGQHLQLPVKQRKYSQKKMVTSGAYKDYKI